MQAGEARSVNIYTIVQLSGTLEERGLVSA